MAGGAEQGVMVHPWGYIWDAKCQYGGLTPFLFQRNCKNVASNRASIQIPTDSHGKKNKFICQWGVRTEEGKLGGTEEIPQVAQSWTPPSLDK